MTPSFDALGGACPPSATDPTSVPHLAHVINIAQLLTQMDQHEENGDRNTIIEAEETGSHIGAGVGSSGEARSERVLGGQFDASSDWRTSIGGRSSELERNSVFVDLLRKAHLNGADVTDPSGSLTEEPALALQLPEFRAPSSQGHTSANPHVRYVEELHRVQALSADAAGARVAEVARRIADWFSSIHVATYRAAAPATGHSPLRSPLAECGQCSSQPIVQIDDSGISSKNHKCAAEHCTPNAGLSGFSDAAAIDKQSLHGPGKTLGQAANNASALHSFSQDLGGQLTLAEQLGSADHTATGTDAAGAQSADAYIPSVLMMFNHSSASNKLTSISGTTADGEDTGSSLESNLMPSPHIAADADAGGQAVRRSDARSVADFQALDRGASAQPQAHGPLASSIKSICAALDKAGSVRAGDGFTLGSKPTWLEELLLVTKSLPNRNDCTAANYLEREDVQKICLQIADACVPVSAGLSALLGALVEYAAKAAGSKIGLPDEAPRESAGCEGTGGGFDGSPEDYLHVLLPGVVQDFNRSLLVLGEAMLEVKTSHAIDELAALTRIEAQMGALSETLYWATSFLVGVLLTPKVDDIPAFGSQVLCFVAMALHTMVMTVAAIYGKAYQAASEPDLHAQAKKNSASPLRSVFAHEFGTYHTLSVTGGFFNMTNAVASAIESFGTSGLALGAATETILRLKNVIQVTLQLQAAGVRLVSLVASLLDHWDRLGAGDRGIVSPCSSKTRTSWTSLITPAARDDDGRRASLIESAAAVASSNHDNILRASNAVWSKLLGDHPEGGEKWTIRPRVLGRAETLDRLRPRSRISVTGDLIRSCQPAHSFRPPSARLAQLLGQAPAGSQGRTDAAGVAVPNESLGPILGAEDSQGASGSERSWSSKLLVPEASLSPAQTYHLGPSDFNVDSSVRMAAMIAHGPSLSQQDLNTVMETLKARHSTAAQAFTAHKRTTSFGDVMHAASIGGHIRAARSWSITRGLAPRARTEHGAGGSRGFNKDELYVQPPAGRDSQLTVDAARASEPVDSALPGGNGFARASVGSLESGIDIAAWLRRTTDEEDKRMIDLIESQAHSFDERMRATSAGAPPSPVLELSSSHVAQVQLVLAEKLCFVGSQALGLLLKIGNCTLAGATNLEHSCDDDGASRQQQGDPLSTARPWGGSTHSQDSAGGADASAVLQAASLVPTFTEQAALMMDQQKTAAQNFKVWTRQPGHGAMVKFEDPAVSGAAVSAQLNEVMRKLLVLTGRDASNSIPVTRMMVLDVIKQLGKSSLGSVWMHKLGQSFAAVKWIDLAQRGDDSSRRNLRHSSDYSRQEKLAMLVREVRALQAVQHPNIVNFLGITSGDGMSQQQWRSLVRSRHAAADEPADARRSGKPCLVGIVMEMCTHGSLEDLIAHASCLLADGRCARGTSRGRAARYQLVGGCQTEQDAMALLFVNSWSLRLRLARQVAGALAACHSAGLMHRDLTTYNVMLTAGDAGESADLCWRPPGSARTATAPVWSVRLIDFGLSAPNAGRSAVERSIAMHSPDWQAPECMEGGDCGPTAARGTHSPASDVYSLGVVLWSIMTVSEPLRNVSAVSTFTRSRSLQLTTGYQARLMQLRGMPDEAAAEALQGPPCPVVRQLCDVALDCMQVDPAARPSAEELAARLERLELQCTWISQVPFAPLACLDPNDVLGE